MTSFIERNFIDIFSKIIVKKIWYTVFSSLYGRICRTFLYFGRIIKFSHGYQMTHRAINLYWIMLQYEEASAQNSLPCVSSVSRGNISKFNQTRRTSDYDWTCINNYSTILLTDFFKIRNLFKLNWGIL